MAGWCEGLVYLVGALTVARWVVYLWLDVLEAARKFLWARLFHDNLRVKYGGSWAVVTGCTDGIGKEYARQLAGRGMNIVLISRNIDKLKNVQKLIKDESPTVETETVQVDFSHGRVVYDKIASQLQGKDIAILVNNVGVAPTVPVKFIDMDEEDVWSQVNVNVGAIVAMTRLVLAQMVARKKGAIINLSSIASTSPMPLVGVYSATKVFDDFFSQSLAFECRGTGVTVQTIRPGEVITNMTKQFGRDPALATPSPETFVKSALPTLGHSERTTGYWPHGLQGLFLASLHPKFFMYLIDYAVTSSMEKTGMIKRD